MFAFAAFATLVHVLVTSVRRRRRDLAILQTLGFRRRQIIATVAWQSLILTGLALAFGVPLGMLLGRLGWSAFAYRFGVVNEPVLSPYSVLVIPITLVVALVGLARARAGGAPRETRRGPEGGMTMAHVLTRRVVRFPLWLLVVAFVVGLAFGAMILVFGRVPIRRSAASLARHSWRSRSR